MFGKEFFCVSLPFFFPLLMAEQFVTRIAFHTHTHGALQSVVSSPSLESIRIDTLGTTLSEAAAAGLELSI